MSIKIEAVKKIQAALDRLGSEYTITIDEQTFTNVQKKKRTRDADRFKAYNIAERIKAAQPGEVLRIEILPETDVTVHQLQSNVSSKACGTFGAGRYITKSSENFVELVVLP